MRLSLLGIALLLMAIFLVLSKMADAQTEGFSFQHFAVLIIAASGMACALFGYWEQGKEKEK